MAFGCWLWQGPYQSFFPLNMVNSSPFEIVLLIILSKVLLLIMQIAPLKLTDIYEIRCKLICLGWQKKNNMQTNKNTLIILCNKRVNIKRNLRSKCEPVEPFLLMKTALKSETVHLCTARARSEPDIWVVLEWREIKRGRERDKERRKALCSDL